MTNRTYSNIQHKVVLELIHYDPDTGELTWLPRSPAYFKTLRSCRAWNTRYANRPAFTFRNPQGHMMGAILGENVEAHRLIWFYVTGEWPDEVDHGDGDGGNNRWTNLKNVPHGTNMKNKRRFSRNKSGKTGVGWYPKLNKWQASIRIDGTLRHLGYHDDFDDAVKAREEAEKLHNFHPNHGRH